MGTPPKNKDEVITSAGSNVTDDTRKEYYSKAKMALREFEKAHEIAKSAKSAYTNVLKSAKKAGLSTKAIARVLAERMADPDELVREEQEYIRIMALSGVMPTFQASLFGDAPDPELVEEGTIDAAFDAGNSCGLAGRNRQENPHFQGTEKWEVWDRGWIAGQEVLFAKAGPKKAKGKKKAPDAVVEISETYIPTSYSEPPDEALEIGADMPEEPESGLFEE